MKERYEGEVIPEGWSFTRAYRIYVHFRMGDMIATLIIDRQQPPEAWASEIKWKGEASDQLRQ